MGFMAERNQSSLVLRFENLTGPKLRVAGIEIPIIEYSRRYLRLVGDSRLKLRRETLYRAQIHFENDRITHVTGAIAGHGENQSYFRFQEPVSNSRINRRSHFRLNFPDSETLTLQVGDCELKVSDLSEGSLQFVRPPQKACTEGQNIAGILTLHDEKAVHIAGTVIRIFPNKCILKLQTRIPYKVIMAEQAYLIRKQNASDSGPMKILGR